MDLVIKNDRRETYLCVSHCRNSDDTRYITRGDSLPWALLEFHRCISAQRWVLSDGNIVKNDLGAHVHQVLKECKTMLAGTRMGEACRGLKYRTQRLENDEWIEMLTMHMNTISRAIKKAPSRRSTDVLEPSWTS